MSVSGSTPLTRRLCLLVAGLACAASAVAPAASSVPSPEHFFGFPMGAERRLVDWTQTAAYFAAVDRASDRVVVQTLGPTTDGRPFLLAIVSAPDTLAHLPRYQALQHRLLDTTLNEAEAARAVRDSKVVVLIGASVHSNEVGSTHAMNDLLYELATSDADWVQRVLRNAIVLLVPSQNPDGLQMTATWYAQNQGTPYEDAPLPDLYHRYAGHDDNRDAYMLTQRESQYLARILYRDWLPEVYLDQHQMGSNGARIFVPPYSDPVNSNVDPLVWSEANELGQAMAARLHAAGRPGVLWGELYSGSWQGANSTNPWWHNMVGLLSEVASTRLATSIYQAPPDHVIGPRGPAGEPQAGDVPVPPPSDARVRINYPHPWNGGRWTFADVVEYHRLAAAGLLEATADNAPRLVRNFQQMGRQTTERFRRGSPFAFVVPLPQRDVVTAVRLVGLLQAGGAVVHRATAPFVADGTRYPRDTFVVLLSQPFGRWVKDLLQRQHYLDARDALGDPPDRPYDVTAWTLGLLMGVDVVEVERPFTAPLAVVSDGVAPPDGAVDGRGPVFLIPSTADASTTAAARLLAEGAHVAWTRSPLKAGDDRFEAGTLVVRGVGLDRMQGLAHELHIRAGAMADLPRASLIPLRQPRLAVYEPWGGLTDAGWTRWVLDQHAIPYTRVRAADVGAPSFPDSYDVLILPDAPDTVLMRGLQGPNVRPEHRGGLSETGITRLRTFVEHGGTLVTLGNASQFAVDRLGLPLTNVVSGVDRDAFYCPGSILRIEVNPRHPIGYGMPASTSALFLNNGAYEPTDRAGDAVTTIAEYPNAPILLSGWMTGEQLLRGAGAVLDVRLGRGHVIIFGLRPQHRGQTVATMKLLFNAIYYGAATADQDEGTQQ